MRITLAVGIVAVASVWGVSAQAADLPQLPQLPDLPQVDYGLGGSFYLRGSVGGSLWWAPDGEYCGCVATFTTPGYGYSLGVGIGYDSGVGPRADVTLDYLSISNLTSSTADTVNLRSGLLLANAYYDFPISGFGAEGGTSFYVGAGFGAAYNYSEIPTLGNWGTSLEAAGAVMAGVSYDMGNMVADIGYRGIYMNKVMDQPVSGPTYLINNNWIHEIRASIRKRLDY